ncbi:hypothetical protein [Bacillus anthracis]
MRYTRNRQRRLLKYNARIDIATGYGRLGKNVRIGNVPKWMHSLDYTFRWHREYGLGLSPWGLNFIEFQGKVRLVKF